MSETISDLGFTMRFSPDVVPVDPTTYDAWTYPPFSGHFDGLLSGIPPRYRSHRCYPQAT